MKLRLKFWRREEGQSLLETAVAMPLLLGIAFNLINLGYFWFCILTLTAAPRQGVQFSAQGSSSLATATAPSTTAISALVYDNMTNALHGSTTLNTSVRVCSKSKGVDATTHVALCDSFGPAFSFTSVAVDPESPSFVLNRVDVGYTVTPLIPGTAFNVVLPSTMSFRRQVSMRSLY